MLCKMKKLKLLVIMMSCVLLTGAIFPGNLFADTVIEEWVARYNGPENLNDIAHDMAVDSWGNVYVTGQSVGSGPASDCTTIKYAPNGNVLWVARYAGPGNSFNGANAIAVDSLGNAYVTGYSSSGTDAEYATVKYDPNGNELWAARYNGPGNGSDVGWAIAVDSSGVYVAGISQGSGTDWDYATVKYDTNGNELWAARYNGPANSGDQAKAMALDSLGNVYVTGESANSHGQYDDYATVKYDTNGNELWVARYTYSAHSTDRPRAMALDSSGNVYVTGYTWGGGTNNHDFVTVKYDTNGNELWVASYDGPGNGSDDPSAIAVDTSGNVYVAGYSYGIGTYGDFVAVKYDADGNELLVARYNSPENSTDNAYAIALDTAGNIYLTGSSYPINSYEEYDYVTVKFDASGTELWSVWYDGPGNDFDVAYDMAVDDSGNVYVSGQSVGSGTGHDYATIKYAQFEDPAEVIEALIAAVISLNLQQGISNSLDAKLGAALQAIDDINANNDVAAIKVLGAFITAVEVQSGNQIPTEDADALIATVQEIIDLLVTG